MWGLGGAHPPAPSEREWEGGGNREDEGADSAEMGAGTEGVDRHVCFRTCRSLFGNS